MSAPAIRHAATWWLWMATQLLVLALFTAQIQFSSRFPPPIEDSAAAAVLAVQVTLVILLNTALLPDYRAAVAAGAGGVVVLLTAELLAGQRAGEAFWPLLLLFAWLLALVKRISPKIQALLAVLTLAGPALLWAAAEAGTSGRSFALWAFSPPVGAITTSLHFPSHLTAFALPLTLILGKFLQNQGLRISLRHRPAAG